MRPSGYEPLYKLKPICRNIWIADGGWISFYGLPYPTRMTIIRLVDGGLWVHSPIAFDQGLADSIAEIGPVRHIIAPNWIHYAWMPQWQNLFPDAVSWGSPGVLERARSRGVALALDHILDDGAPNEWRGQIDQRLAASDYHKELVFFHRSSRTLVLTDLIENFEARKMPWWTRPLLKLFRVCHPDGRMPRDMALGFRNHRNHLRDVVQTMIGWQPERVILAHGLCYAENGEQQLRRAFRDVLRPLPIPRQPA